MSKTMLYKTPGPHEIHGGHFDYITVSDADIDAHLDAGWYLSTTDAVAAEKWAKDRAAASALEQAEHRAQAEKDRAAEEDAKRQELEAGLAQLKADREALAADREAFEVEKQAFHDSQAAEDDPASLEALQAKAASLGIAVDNRWKETRLQKEIDAVEKA